MVLTGNYVVFITFKASVTESPKLREINYLPKGKGFYVSFSEYKELITTIQCSLNVVLVLAVKRA